MLNTFKKSSCHMAKKKKKPISVAGSLIILDLMDFQCLHNAVGDPQGNVPICIVEKNLRLMEHKASKMKN